MSEFFRFEKQDEDLPFYRGETVLSLKGALLLFICLILFAIPIVFPIPMTDLEFSLYLCLILLIPNLYLLRGHLNLMFKRCTRSDILIIVACVILSFVYSISVLFLLMDVGIASSEPIAAIESFDLLFIISLMFQLMGEELFKILTFLLFMFLSYRFCNNRKVSLVIGLLVSMTAFGFMHSGFYGGFVQVFLIQGLGSIFDFYAYLKTRNIFVSYAAHVIFDLLLSIPV